MNAATKPQSASIALDLSNDKYHSLPAISSSQLKEALRSPAHYFAKYLAEDREPSEATANMQLGSAVHVLFLEPAVFEREVAVAPECDRRTKVGKEAWAAFIESAAGKIILTADQMKDAEAMANSLHAHPINKIVMEGTGCREASIFYRDTESDLACRVRPDYHIAPCDKWPNGLIIDLKTTDDARPAAFARTIANFGYHTSAAMYCDGFQAYYGTENSPEFLWLVIERNRPYACAAYEVTDDVLFVGHAKKREALELIAHCQRLGEWPSYSLQINPIALPAWAI
jgi:hypothetical protein